MTGPKGKMRISPMHQTKLRDARLSNIRQAPRCGAKTRKGTPCQAPAMWSKKRCRMHGGAYESGNLKGPGNSNYRHGQCTRSHGGNAESPSSPEVSNKQLLALLRRP